MKKIIIFLVVFMVIVSSVFGAIWDYGETTDEAGNLTSQLVCTASEDGKAILYILKMGDTYGACIQIIGDLGYYEEEIKIKLEVEGFNPYRAKVPFSYDEAGCYVWLYGVDFVNAFCESSSAQLTVLSNEYFFDITGLYDALDENYML